MDRLNIAQIYRRQLISTPMMPVCLGSECVLEEMCPNHVTHQSNHTVKWMRLD